MILFLGHAGEIGGAELCQLDIARHFRGESRVLLFSDGPYRSLLESAGIDVEVIPGGNALHAIRRESGPPGPRSVARVLALAKRVASIGRKYDLLYAYTQKAFVIACAAAAICRRPLLWHLHDILAREHFSASNIRLDVELGNRFARRIVAVSNAVRDAFIAQGGRPDRVRVVHNGIDPRPFQEITAPEIAYLRAQLGVESAPLIGCFGRLSSWKGQHLLIEALRDLPEAHAILVGGSLFGSGEYEQELRRLTDEAGMSERVHFLGVRNDVPLLMKACDVIAHTSVAPEPFARVVIEAMLAGKPLVTAMGGGVVEIVEHERTGLLYTPGNVEQLRAGIARLLADRERARELGVAAREHAEARFGLQSMLSGVERQVRELLAA